MKDPTRLLAGAGTDFERQLLRPASSEPMPADLKLRMQEGLGLVPSAAGTTALAGKLGLLAWTSAGVLAVGFGGGVLGARLFRDPPPPAAAVAPAPRAGTPALPPTVEPPVVPVAAPAPVASRSVAPRRASAQAPASTPAPADLRDEIALIDGAREAIVQRAPARALELLRRYAAGHPRGAFAPEAAVLHVEALEQSGQHSDAVVLARRFLAAHPDSPLAPRVGRLVQ